MMKSKIYHPVLLFEILHVEYHGIVQIVATSRIKQPRKEESNSDSFCNTRPSILVVLVFNLPKFLNNNTNAQLSSHT